MRSIPSLTVGLLVFCAATSAFAQERRFQLGVRTGFSLPMGNAVGNGTTNVGGAMLTFNKTALSDVYKYQVPIWIDAGYMVTQNLMLGIYFQYGLIGVKQETASNPNGCPTGSSCSAHSIHYGIQAQYHLSPNEGLNPWFGLGFGRETIYNSETAGGATQDFSFGGWEFATFQGGLDFKAAEGVGIGPFLAFSLAQYSSASATIGGASVSYDLPGAMHEWLTLGVRGQFGF